MLNKGFLLLDKAKDITSFTAINDVKHILKFDKVGHIGTLDPFATGLLIVLVNSSTKLNQFVDDENKEYIAKIRLGILTDTLDITGTITNTKEVGVLNKEEIEKVLFKYLGDSIQTPPVYSAIRVNGKRLMEYARSNINVQPPKRQIHINEISLLDFTDNTITIKVNCSKGTYIRSLGRDIANDLSTVGVLEELRRTKIGNFSVDDSYTYSDIQVGKYSLLTETLLLNKKNIYQVKDELINDIKNGKKINLNTNLDVVYLVDLQNNLLAAYKKVEDGYKCIRGLF